VTTRKKTKPITIGEKIFPNKIPNLYQIIFNGVKIFDLNNPNKKNIKEIINKTTLILSFLINGYIDKIKKKIEKTKPTLLLDGSFILF